MQQNPYLTLGLLRDATQAEIDHATRGLIARCNAELAQGLPEAQERLDAVHAAYQAIGSEEARARFAQQEAMAMPAPAITVSGTFVPAIAGVAPARATWAPPRQEFDPGTAWQPMTALVGGIVALIAGAEIVRGFLSGNGLDVLIAHALLFSPPGVVGGLAAIMLGHARIDATRRLDLMDARGDTKTDRSRYEALARGHTLTYSGVWLARVGLAIVIGFWVLVSVTTML